MRQKGHNRPAATPDKGLSSGIMASFDDNAINGFVAFTAHCWRVRTRNFRLEVNMSSLKAMLGILVAGLMLSGCVQTTYQAAPEASLKPADKAQLAKARYAKVVNEPFRRAIVDYHRKEMAGSIVVDSDNHYLYVVQDSGKAIRYGITVGEEVLASSGIAKIGNMEEWLKWTPTADIHKRIEGWPASVTGVSTSRRGGLPARAALARSERHPGPKSQPGSRKPCGRKDTTGLLQRETDI